MTPTTEPLRLSEEFVQDCFHSYLKSSLTQAKVERLVDTELLSSAEGDLMITGPALCLYFAALRCTTNPPSVPLPKRGGKAGAAGMTTDLSENNCPIAFLSFLQVWADTVPRIQGLVPEHQHDLARIVCGLNPLSSQNLALNGIAADLRAVAIEISQRRTFQNRYAEDLQAVIDVGGGASGLRVTASFVPPPMYDAAPPAYEPPLSSTASSSFDPSDSPPPPLPDRPRPLRDSKSSHRRREPKIPPPVPPKDPPVSPRDSPISLRIPSASSRARSVSPRIRPVSPRDPPVSPRIPPLPPRDPPVPPKDLPREPRPTPLPPSPSYLSDPSTPAISIIRETLYAALADVIERSPSIRRLMKSDPPRAYFAAVAFGILDVVTTAITPNGGIRAVMGHELTLETCPRELRPFMIELVAIGSAVKECEAEDRADAIEISSRGGTPPEPRMERTRKMLENGVGYSRRRRRSGEDGGNSNRRSVQGRAVTLSNRINALALGMTRLKAFRDNQNDVFSVLAALGS